jgi:hypothetical protein
MIAVDTSALMAIVLGEPEAAVRAADRGLRTLRFRVLWELPQWPCFRGTNWA